MDHRKAIGLPPKPSLVAHLQENGVELSANQAKVAEWIDNLDDDTINAVMGIIKAAGGVDQQLFIPLKEASRRLNMCVPKLQEFSRSHYKGFPAVLDGNKYKVNARMLPEWADRFTVDAIEGRL